MTHTPDVNWADVVDDLDRGDTVSRPMDEQIVGWLAPPPGARVADLGSGAGGMTVLLAGAVGAEGSVVAVDGEPALLEATMARSERAGFADRIETLLYDLAAGTPPLVDLDLVWAAHVVHHLPDQQSAVTGLVRMIAGGGRLALAEGGLPQRCLPWDVGVGEPGLEDRLASAEADWFAGMRRDQHGARRIPYGWPSVIAAAGLNDVMSKSFLLDLPAPLDVEVRTHITESFAVRVDRVGERLNGDDRGPWDRLLEPDGADYLGRRDDLHVLGATTVHVGTRQSR
ncbi:MAG: methyltransferase domain-containing protein [Nocardioidaceae bacterium]|nr:methyltransferase domain-containing protein [Nocardioidaceae bacterium]